MNRQFIYTKTIIAELDHIIKKTNIEDNNLERFNIIVEQINNNYFALCFNTILNLNIFEIYNFSLISKHSEEYFKQGEKLGLTIKINSYIINEFCKKYAKSEFNTYTLAEDEKISYELNTLAHYHLNSVIILLGNLILSNEYLDQAIQKYKSHLIHNSNYPNKLIEYEYNRIDFIADTLKNLINNAFFNFM